MEHSSESNDAPRFSRRKLLGGALGAGITAAGIVKLNAEHDLSPEILHDAPEFVGFNTALYANEIVPHDLTLEAFKEDIETLSENGNNMIRFSLRNDELVIGGDEQTITWNHETLAMYDQAIAYAKEKGIEIFLVGNTPDFAAAYTPEAYQATSVQYFTEIAKHFGDTITLLQLFNEPNIHNYRDYGPLPEGSDYHASFSTLVEAIAKQVKQANPQILTTVNVGGWPLNDNLVEQWSTFYDGMAEHLDVLSLDMYPDDNVGTIDRLPSYVQRFQQQFGKEVAIAEIGIATGTGRFTEQDQGKYLSQAIRTLETAGVMAILPYEIRDSARIPDAHEASFGIKTADGQPKASFAVVMDSLEQKEAPEEQNTSHK